MAAKRKILIIVENETVPFDSRVWKEARSLHDDGYEVTVLSPKRRGYTAAHEILNGIHIYRHPLPLEAKGAIGYLREYCAALFWEFVLAWKIFFKKRFQCQMSRSDTI